MRTACLGLMLLLSFAAQAEPPAASTGKPRASATKKPAIDPSALRLLDSVAQPESDDFVRTIDVKGLLDRSKVERILRASQKDVTFCFKSSQFLMHVAEVEIYVTAAGAMEDLKVRLPGEDDDTSSRVSQCIENAFRQQKLPRAKEVTLVRAELCLRAPSDSQDLFRPHPSEECETRRRPPSAPGRGAAMPVDPEKAK